MIIYITIHEFKIPSKYYIIDWESILLENIILNFFLNSEYIRIIG